MSLQWFHGLARREQHILLLGGPLIILLLAWVLLISPLRQAQAQLQAQIASQQLSLEWMRGAAQRVQALREAGSRPAGSLSLRQQVSRLSAARQIAVSRVQPLGDGRLGIWASHAGYGASLQLLDALSDEGIRIEQAQMSALSEPGRIDLYLTLSRGEAQ